MIGLFMFLSLSGKGQYSEVCFRWPSTPKIDQNQPWPYASITLIQLMNRGGSLIFATRYLYEVDEFGYLKSTARQDLDLMDLTKGITEPEPWARYIRNTNHQIISSIHGQNESSKQIARLLYHPNGQVAYEEQITAPYLGSLSTGIKRSTRYRPDGLILADSSWTYHHESGLEVLNKLTTYQYEGENLTEEIQYIQTEDPDFGQVREHKKWLYSYRNDSLLKESYFEWDSLSQAMQLREYQEYTFPPGQEFVFIRDYELDSVGFSLRNLFREYSIDSETVSIFRKERWEENRQEWLLTHNDTTLFDDLGRKAIVIRNLKHDFWDNWTSPDTFTTTYLGETDVILSFEYFLNGSPWCRSLFQKQYELRDDFSLTPDPPVFQILAFPNPSSGMIQVLFPENTLNKIDVFSATGQPIYQHEAEAKVFEVDLRAYQSGIFFIRGTSGDQMAVEKVVRE